MPSQLPVKNVVAILGQGHLSYRGYLNWINNILGTKYTKLEELSTGSAYCEILHLIFPESFCEKKITKVKEFPAALDNSSSRRNLYLLKDTLAELGVTILMKGKGSEKDINEMEIEKMCKTCSYPSHFKFLQWFKLFCDKNKKEDLELSLAKPDKDEKGKQVKQVKSKDVAPCNVTATSPTTELEEKQAYFYMATKCHEMSVITKESYAEMTQRTKETCDKVNERSDKAFTIFEKQSNQVIITLAKLQEAAEEIKMASRSMSEVAEKISLITDSPRSLSNCRSLLP